MPNNEAGEPKKQWVLRNLPEEVRERTDQLQDWMRDAGKLKAEVQRYHVNMKRFGVKVHDNTNNRMLYLLGMGCSFLKTHTEWEPHHIEVLLGDDAPAKLILCDTNVGFRVECQVVDVSTNSWWFFEGGEVIGEPTVRPGKPRIISDELDSRYVRELEQRRIDIDSRHCPTQDIGDFFQEWLSSSPLYHAEVWSYRAESRLLDLRLQGIATEGSRENLHVVCGGTHRFKSQTWQRNAKIDILPPTQDVPRWLIQDVVSGILIECDFLRASLKSHEDCRQRYSKSLFWT